MNANTWSNGHIGALLMASVYFALNFHPYRPKGDNDMKIAK